MKSYLHPCVHCSVTEPRCGSSLSAHRWIDGHSGRGTHAKRRVTRPQREWSPAVSDDVADLEGIMLREVSQRKTNTIGSRLMQTLYKREKKAKLIEKEVRPLVVARGGGRGTWREGPGRCKLPAPGRAVLGTRWPACWVMCGTVRGAGPKSSCHKVEDFLFFFFVFP